MIFFADSSIASLVGGLLINSYQYEIPDILQLSGFVGLTGGSLYLILYHLIGKKFDEKLVRKLDEKYPERWNSENVANVSLPLESAECKIANF